MKDHEQIFNDISEKDFLESVQRIQKSYKTNIALAIVTMVGCFAASQKLFGLPFFLVVTILVILSTWFFFRAFHLQELVHNPSSRLKFDIQTNQNREIWKLW